MIATYTPAQAGNLTIPATEELLRGWTGPVEYLWPHGKGVPAWDFGAVLYGQPMYKIWEGLPCRLPLSRPEVRDRVLRVMAEGDLSAFRDGPKLTVPNWMPAELSAALLYLSWVRMAAGMGPILHLLRPGVNGTWVSRTLAVERVPHNVSEWEMMASGFALLHADGTLTAEIPARCCPCGGGWVCR